MIRLVSWNMARRRDAWLGLTNLDADLALLQEAARPQPESPFTGSIDPAESWETSLLGGRGQWKTAIVPPTDRTELHPRATMTLETATSAADWVVSRAGSIAAADVISNEAPPFTAVSVYAVGNSLRQRLR